MSDKDEHIDWLISDLLEKVGIYQMSEEEYRYIVNFLSNKNFLVFGCGYDSNLWRYANRSGITMFLEHDPKWITNNKDTALIKYTCKISEFEKLLEDFEKGCYDNLKIDVPEIIMNIKWDVILIDSPPGFSDECIGRMQSIYTSYALANVSTHILIHDCDREVEAKFSASMFKIVRQIKKLRHCVK